MARKFKTKARYLAQNGLYNMKVKSPKALSQIASTVEFCLTKIILAYENKMADYALSHMLHLLISECNDFLGLFTLH